MSYFYGGMKNTAILLFVIWMNGIPVINGQYLFYYRGDECNLSAFGLDGDEIEAGYDSLQMSAFLDNLSAKWPFTKNTQEVWTFQMMIDEAGKACVACATNDLTTKQGKYLVEELTLFNGWKPAYTGGIADSLVAIIFSLQWNEKKFSGHIIRWNGFYTDAFLERPVWPKIMNDQYKYSNLNLGNYSIRVWNKLNSVFTEKRISKLALDSLDNVWCVNNWELYKLANDSVNRVVVRDSLAIPVEAHLAIDNQQRLWAMNDTCVIALDSTLEVFETDQLDLKGLNSLNHCYKTNELFFATDTGLFVLRNKKWSIYNRDKITAMTTNRILYAKRDSQFRLWIGTVNETIMIDKRGAITNFNALDHIFNGLRIEDFDEDSKGNLYCVVRDVKRVNPGEERAGLVTLDATGYAKLFQVSNSGLPVNFLNEVTYDEIDQVLWLSTNEAGLVRWDLKHEWEVYHFFNSMMPTSMILDSVIDRHGVLSMATNQGIVRLYKNAKE